MTVTIYYRHWSQKLVEEVDINEFVETVLVLRDLGYKPVVFLRTKKIWE